jgi:pyridoxal phosphate enzyme (YggS family)
VRYGRGDLDAAAIRQNRERIEAEVDAARRRAGLSPGGVEMLAAIKYVDAEALETLAEAGVRLVGENRAQDLAARYDRFSSRFTWDFIGHLQSNKVRQVLPRVRLIHSVESISVLREIQRRAHTKAKVLLQVNIGEEPGKYGIIPSEVNRFLEEAESFTMVDFTGLMTMPPLAADPEDSRPLFAALRELSFRLARDWRGRHSFRELSMGTSNDYVVAAEEGATIIRVGSVLYGCRRRRQD